MAVIKILVADDHAVVREGLRLLLGTQADMEVVGEACDGVEALEKARQLKPDVALLDVAMPRMTGLEAASLIREVLPKTQVVILSMFEKEAYARKVLAAGARGYVLKGSSSDELLKAIRAVHGGEYFLSRRIQATVIDGYLCGDRNLEATSNFDLLSDREKQVFLLLVEGNSTAQMSEILCISPKTVEKHRSAVSRKLGISNPVDLVKFAIRIGVVDPDAWRS